MNTENLVNLIRNLKQPERVVLIHALNKYDGNMSSPIHEGSLAFVNKAFAQRALRAAFFAAAANEKQKRYIKQIEDKLGFRDVKGVTFQMHLNTKKMQRALGDPSRVVLKLPCTKYVGSGIRYNIFQKERGSIPAGKYPFTPSKYYEKPKGNVFHHIECRLEKGSLWNITCSAGVKDLARTYLFTKYGKV